MHAFRDRPTAKALRADQKRRIGPSGGSDADFLQIRFELTPGNPSHLGTDSTKVFGFTAGSHPIAHLGAFTANFANPRHRITPE